MLNTFSDSKRSSGKLFPDKKVWLAIFSSGEKSYGYF